MRPLKKTKKTCLSRHFINYPWIRKQFFNHFGESFLTTELFPQLYFSLKGFKKEAGSATCDLWKKPRRHVFLAILSITPELENSFLIISAKASLQLNFSPNYTFPWWWHKAFLLLQKVLKWLVQSLQVKMSKVYFAMLSQGEVLTQQFFSKKPNENKISNFLI